MTEVNDAFNQGEINVIVIALEKYDPLYDHHIPTCVSTRTQAKRSALRKLYEAMDQPLE